MNKGSNENLACPADVESSLRDRIAYAIAQSYGDPPGKKPATWDYELADAVIRELEDGYVLVPKNYTIVKAVTGRMDCNPHPDAPHGFDRNASHDEGRNVCDCERWSPPDEDDPYEAIAGAERQQWADDEGIPR